MVDQRMMPMLTLRHSGRGAKLCDGVSRRDFMKIGGLGLGGLSLAQLLQAEAHAGVRNSKKAVIMIYLVGGPPHQDLFDLKPDAPAEIAGPHKPIATNVPGIEICELLPQLAQRMDKLVPIRSIVGASGAHDAYECLTGRQRRGPQPPGGWPCLGSALSKLAGPVNSAMPPFVGLAPKMGHVPWSDNGDPGYLGVAHAPFKPSGEGKDDMVLNGVTLDRLGDRQALLASFDRFRREADATGMMDGLDTFNEQAFGVLTSSRLMEALDIEKEDPKIRARYGQGDPKNRNDGGPKLMEHFLMARRLI
jgi:hypothetical protein